jgi:hypothetical protein
VFQASDVLSLFETTGPAGEMHRFIYEIVLKPATEGSADPARSTRILQSLEEGQTQGGYSLEGLIHWRGGLLIRLRLPHSRNLQALVEFLRLNSCASGQTEWESEPESVRLIHPEMAEQPANAFTHQMDRIRRSLDSRSFPSVGLFYYHRDLDLSVVPAA